MENNDRQEMLREQLIRSVSSDELHTRIGRDYARIGRDRFSVTVRTHWVLFATMESSIFTGYLDVTRNEHKHNLQQLQPRVTIEIWQNEADTRKRNFTCGYVVPTAANLVFGVAWGCSLKLALKLGPF